MGTERIEKYISFQELPPMGKTRRWYVRDKLHTPFAVIKWYGGWRKYVCFFDECYCDADCLRMIADFCAEKTKEHMAGVKSKHE